MVRKILHTCTICHRFEGQSYNMFPPPPLPSFRVREEPAFTHTGVDFAGPLHVKTPNSATQAKAWICLHTCCVVRAIHLDLVPDMTSNQILSLGTLNNLLLGEAFHAGSFQTMERHLNLQ